ncbi:MAG: DUF1302 domain-containing protein [Pseudomonadota bacterium]
MQRKPVAIGRAACFGLFGAPARRGFLLASLLPLGIASANAMELDFADGEVAGRFDNTLSYGVAFRTQGADRFLAAETRGTGPDGFYSELAANNVKTAANKNDGNGNFPDAGDIVSNTVKWNSLLELTWDRYGMQVSGFAFHDFALEDIEGTHGEARDFLNSVDASDRFDNERLTSQAADYAVSDARLSSAYVWGDFEIGSRTLNVRLGEQVLSWGEALFMQDGINQANPADLSALRLPGAEIKDALLPLPMLVVSTNITDMLSAEAFYEFGWKRSEADPVGTFYSTTDAFFGLGSESVIIDVENTLTPVPSTDPGYAAYVSAESRESVARIYNAFARGIVDPTDPMGTRLSNNKLSDRDPRDDGQYGLALRYLAESLNNTEFGFYFLNYHARKPTAVAVLGDAYGSSFDNETCAAASQTLMSVGVAAADAECQDMAAYTLLPVGNTVGDLVRGFNAMHYIDSTKYYLEYEQNQQVWGLTFSTNIGETSFSGEFAYRPDAEFLPEVGDNLIAYNAVAATTLGSGGSIDTSSSTSFGDHIGDGATLSAGDTVAVSDEEDMLNVSLLAIHNFGPTWITDGLTGVLELGGAWVNGLDENKDYAAEGALGYVPAANLLEGNVSRQYLDDFAWGYRVVLAAEFNDVAAGLNLKPQIRYAQDVEGNGIVGGNFVENRESATVALDAEYAGNWTFGVGTNVFWGRADRNDGNQLADRDNVYANVKYSF